MSNPISQPSRPLYFIDVPEVRKFQAVFKYNFFVKDESINDSAPLTNYVRSRTFDQFTDSDVVLKGRIPRYVKLSWAPSQLYGLPRNSQNLRRENQQGQSSNSTLIASNYKKIIFEDQISSLNFCAITLNDGAIDKKIYAFVSGAYDLHMLGEKNVSGNAKFQQIANIKDLFDASDVDFAVDAFSQPDLSYGILKKKDLRQVGSQNDTRPENIKNNLYESLKKLGVNFSLNTKIGSSIVEKSIRDPFCLYTEDLFFLKDKLREMGEISARTRGTELNELDYRPKIEFIEIFPISTISGDENYQELVGYVVDKYEVLRDGTIKEHHPIIVENSQIGNIIDVNVKYGTNYVYSIRTIAAIKMPMSNQETGEISLVKFLVSSKSSENLYVETKEMKAPPPPSDINFSWDYANQNLLIRWGSPVNSQRDIKKFQVFKRSNIEHPFELIREYDFDDSIVKYPSNENTHPKLIKKSTSPVTSFTDEEFTKESKCIYALCSIDAHGLTSNYSPQYQISFDKIKNQITKKIISHSGAPKPYPNLYLPGNGMVDVAHAHGPHSKKATLFFTPQCYEIIDSNNRMQRTVETNLTGGSYKFNFINVDNQKNEILDVKIEDIT